MNDFEQDVIKRLERIEKRLDAIEKAASKRTWLKVGVIQELTGWNDSEAMRKARDNGLVKQRRGVNGIEYLLESIPPMFLKKKEMQNITNEPIYY